MNITHLSQSELATRWRISKRTLERWRWLGEGPRFIKLGGRAIYRLADIEAFEADRLRSNTSQTQPIPDFRNECAAPAPASEELSQPLRRRRAS